MSTYGERLQMAMDDAKVDRSTLANRLDISGQAIGAVLSGKTKMFDALNHSLACEILQCRPLWLASGAGPKRTPAGPPNGHGIQEAPAAWNVEPPAGKDIQDAIIRLGQILALQDEPVRNAVASLMADLARNPTDAESIASMAAALVQARSKRAA